MASEAGAKPIDAPEIAEDIVFQRRVWIWQRIFWVMMALTILAAILGLFGDGLFSRATMSDPTGRVRVSYERFGRLGSTNEMAIVVKPDRDGPLRLWFGDRFLEDFKVEDAGISQGRIILVEDGSIAVIESGSRAAEVRLRLEIRPKQLGWSRIEFGLDRGPRLSMSQIVYP